MTTAESGQDTPIHIMRGGPFYNLMTGLDLRTRAGRACVFALLSWLFPPAVKTSALLINKGNVLPLLLPALIPLLICGAVFLFYTKLGPIVKRLPFL